MISSFAKIAASIFGQKLGEIVGDVVSAFLPVGVRQDSRYVEALLTEQRNFSAQVLQLFGEWQNIQVQGKLKEIQTIFDQKNLSTIFSREESHNILVRTQQKHRLLVLVSPPKISLTCSPSLQHDLPIELPEKLKSFLNEHYPIDGDVRPVEFYGDYFLRPVGDADIRQLQTILSPISTVVLHSNISDCEAYFHVSFWNPQSDNIVKLSMPAWNWEEARESLDSSFRNEVKSIRVIRQIIASVHQLLAAFITDWYYLNINPKYEPCLFRLDPHNFSGYSSGFTSDWIQPYVETLERLQAQQLKAYEKEIKRLSDEAECRRATLKGKPGQNSSVEKFCTYEEYLKWFRENRLALTPFTKEAFYRSLRYAGEPK